MLSMRTQGRKRGRPGSTLYPVSLRTLAPQNAFRATQLLDARRRRLFYAASEQFRERGAEVSRRMNDRNQRTADRCAAQRHIGCGSICAIGNNIRLTINADFHST